MLSMRKSQKRCSKKLKMKLKNTKISVTYQPDNTQRMKKKSVNCSFLLQSVLLKIIAICNLSDQFECLKFYFEIWPRNNTDLLTVLGLLLHNSDSWAAVLVVQRTVINLDEFFKSLQERNMCKSKNKKTEWRKGILKLLIPQHIRVKRQEKNCYVNYQP